ncbi:MAG: extracellular solute-binding protein [Desulfovibrio sp.]
MKIAKQFLICLLGLLCACPAFATPVHVLSIDNSMQDSTTPPYFKGVNPNAPKGGTIRLSATGTFDSFNQYSTYGVSAAGIVLTTGTLTAAHRDNPFVQYPYIAERFEITADNSWVIFHLNPNAKFSNGESVTAEDVVFTFDTLKTKGNPKYKQYYRAVEKAETTGPLSVKFVFTEKNNRELPIIVGQLPVLSKSWWQTQDFSKATLNPPVGCGPYKIKNFRAGYSLEYERVNNWWGQDLPIHKGRYNFDTIRFDYYRDRTVAAEAFRSGEFDYMVENTAKNWANNYVGPAFDQNLIKLLEVKHSRTAGMSGFFFNTRRGHFSDVRVREAISMMFDFNWTNTALFYGQYTRADSFFSNSDLAASSSPNGLPTEEEKRLLAPWKSLLPEKLFTQKFTTVSTDGSGRIRNQMRTAMALLQSAGWHLENGVLKNQSGTPFTFELLLRSGSLERVVLPFQRNLKRLGITMNITSADSSRYTRKVRSHDYDMIYTTVRQSTHPGNEQRNFWASTSAPLKGSRNWAGISHPAVDGLVEKVILAQNKQELHTAVHALDRVLLWNHYVIPGWYSQKDRVAYWDKFGIPDYQSSRGMDRYSWWIVPEKDQRIQNSRFRSGKASNVGESK